MILQALFEYYQRNRMNLPQKGFQTQEIKFVVEIDGKGSFLNLADKREGKKGKEYLLPKAIGRSGKNSWQTTNLLWDHYGYILGHPKDDSSGSAIMANRQLKVFIDSIKGLPAKVRDDEGVKAILLFYENKQYEKVKQHSGWHDCAKIKGCNLSFQLQSDMGLVPEREMVRNYQATVVTDVDNDEEQDEEGQSVKNRSFEACCLITGEHAFVKRLHTATPILGSKSNAKIVGFQKNSGFDSYSKEQAFNAPVSSDAEFAYSAALKYLIKSQSNRLLIGDTTVIFWAQKQSKAYSFETDFPWFFRTEKDNPDKGVTVVKNLYAAFRLGKLPVNEERGNRFYVLGLAPNAARISVRFWKTGTIKDFADNVLQHFEDFRIVHGPKEQEFLTLTQIMSSTVLDYKMDRVPPNLIADVIVSILDGTPYPRTLLQQCIRRIRAEQHVNRTRAAILKASINRFNRFHNKKKKEVLMSLDSENMDAGYLLGRLFAILEKVQIQSAGGEGKLNSTIRDRFYGAFSSSPMTVMPILLKLKNHHIAKIESGRAFFEGLIGKVMDGINAQKIPAHLTLEQQAQFAVGYYHQRQDFFKKKDITTN